MEYGHVTGDSDTFPERIVRVLVPLGFMTAKDDGQYSLTPLAPALAEGSPLKEGLIHITHLYPAISRMPEYFAANKYHNPRDALDAPFNLAFNYKGKTLFDFYAQPENARYAKAFNVTMEMQKGRSDDAFVESYPANERLANNDSQRVLFVDVGGGLGHQIRKFQNSYPSLQGQYILEDLPEVVEKATDLPPSTTKVGHNFFQPQPDAVNNAKAFYLRTILHDWPNQQAAAILKHIVDAMAKDSVVLVHDIIMPEAGVGLMDAKMDIHMMTLGALERTEKQWTALADSVGLKINGFWKEKAGDIGTRGLIEMAKK